MTFPLARFVARDRAHAHDLLIHKALPLKVKGAIRARLETIPDERMLITVMADHTITIEPCPHVVVPQPQPSVTPSPDQPATTRRSRK